jgi:hypothetical protein
MKPALWLIARCSLAASTLPAAEAPITLAEDLLDPAQPDTLGLAYATGAETITLFRPGPDGPHYNHGAVLFPFKGRLYARWRASARDEDAPGWIRGRIPKLPYDDPAVSRELEPSWFRRPDGSLVMVFRDQAPGYSYPKSVLWGDHLYVAYAANKEDIELTRLPLRPLAPQPRQPAGFAASFARTYTSLLTRATASPSWFSKSASK